MPDERKHLFIHRRRQKSTPVFEFYQNVASQPGCASSQLDLHKTVRSDQTQQPLRKLIYMQDEPQTTAILFAKIDAVTNIAPQFLWILTFSCSFSENCLADSSARSAFWVNRANASWL